MSGLEIVDRVIDGLIGEFSDDTHQDSLRHHFSTGGKKLRARLALSAVEALGGTRENGATWGAACELLHNATLIHDDLQDGDSLRRGQPTVWFKYGANQAINAGDSCLMFPFLALRGLAVTEAVKWQLSHVLAAGAALTVRGQALELELPKFCEDSSLLKTKYLKCISEKTSALFEVPVTGAALVAGLQESEAKLLGAELKNLGLLFQMQDDILDLYGAKGRDKPGGDLREGKVSCLVATHLSLNPQDAQMLAKVLAKTRETTTDAEVDFWIQRFRESGALTQSIQEIQRMKLGLATSHLLLESPGLHQFIVDLMDLALAPIQHVLTEHSMEHL